MPSSIVTYHYKKIQGDILLGVSREEIDRYITTLQLSDEEVGKLNMMLIDDFAQYEFEENTVDLKWTAIVFGILMILLGIFLYSYHSITERNYGFAISLIGFGVSIILASSYVSERKKPSRISNKRKFKKYE